MNVLITGPTNGIGRETALALAREGHRLFLLCRNEALGQELCNDIRALGTAPEARLLLADLGDMQQVRAAAERFVALKEPLHQLINNAGIVNTRRVPVHVGATELEQVFTVNHLGHFLLTWLLLPRLITTSHAEGRASRLIIVSSEAHALFCKGIDFDDLGRRQGFRTFGVYGQSKLANLLMMNELIARLDARELTVCAAHPGPVNTNLGTQNEQRWYTRPLKAVLAPFFLSPAQGAETSLYLASAATVQHGGYYASSKPKRLKPWATDREAAQRLWSLSTELLQLADWPGELKRTQA